MSIRFVGSTTLPVVVNFHTPAVQNRDRAPEEKAQHLIVILAAVAAALQVVFLVNFHKLKYLILL